MELTRRKFGLASLYAAAAVSALPSTALIAGCNTSWITTAEKDLPIIVQVGETVIAIVGTLTANPVLSVASIALINEAAKAFGASLTLLQDAITAYQAAPGDAALKRVIAALDAAQNDAPAVISSISQVPARIVSVITGAIGTAITLLSAIESLLPPSVSPAGNKAAVKASARVAVKTKIELPNAQILKGQFNSLLSIYGFGELQIN